MKSFVYFSSKIMDVSLSALYIRRKDENSEVSVDEVPEVEE